MDTLATRFFNSPVEYGKAMELHLNYEQREHTGNWSEVEDFLTELDAYEENLLEKAIEYSRVKTREDKHLKEQNKILLKTIETLQSAKNHIQTPTKEELTSSPLLSSIINDYLKDVSLGWDAKHYQGNERDLKPRILLFLEVIGDKQCHTINREDIKRFKDVMTNYPANKNKKLAYRGLSIDDLMNMKVPDKDKLSITSINKNLEKASSFLKWLRANSSYVTEELWHPLSKRPKNVVPEDEQRDEFSDDDLVKLFQSKEYTNGLHSSPSRYWVPLLGLFTGARENELCQLYKSDVSQDDETKIWFIDINQNSPDKKLKKAGHKRLVPIHPQLVKLGFIEFATNIKTERLFNELSHRRDGYGSAFSKWFNRTYRSEKHCNVGNKVGEKKNFHSFRHTFINQLEKKGVPQPQIARLVGQQPSDGSVTSIRYGKKNSAKENQKIINKISYPIDFSTIKRWR